MTRPMTLQQRTEAFVFDVLSNIFKQRTTPQQIKRVAGEVIAALPKSVRDNAARQEKPDAE